MEMKKRIYIGNGKEVVGHEYLVSGSLSMTDIENWIKEHPLTPYKNGKKYLNITIARNQVPDKFGHTHTISINDYKPKIKEQVQELQ